MLFLPSFLSLDKLTEPVLPLASALEASIVSARGDESVLAMSVDQF